jgi:hypothetical protein
VELLPVVPARWWHWWGLALLTALAAVAACLPTLHNDFVSWDDPTYITENKDIRVPGGLARIWNPRHAESQFYPLVFTSYWLEYRAWGLNPRGYHLTNMVLHAANAALLLAVLWLLGVKPWVAWLTAGLFALHPINVASVAWATERKNVLSTLFYLLALACFLRHLRRGGWLPYAATLLLFAAALLSKTAVLTLPATALLCDRLIARRWSWRGLARIAPLLVLAGAGALITAQVEAGVARASMVALSWPLRPLAAAGALWFYLGKILVPVNYPGVYARWNIPATWPIFAFALAGLPLAGFLLWKARRRLPDHVWWGLGHYVVALTPALGLIPFNYTQFSFVADHFVYLPGIGVFLALATGADRLRTWFGTGRTTWLAATVPACAVLAALGLLTWRQNTVLWKNARTFWERTVALAPGGWAGHFNLGNLDRREARWADAAEQYRLCVAARPDVYQAYGSLAEMLVQLGDRAGAVENYRTGIRYALVKYRTWTEYHFALADLLVQLGRPDEAEPLLREVVERKSGLAEGYVKLANFLRRQGRTGEAIAVYERALKLAPDDAAARQGLRAAQEARPAP